MYNEKSHAIYLRSFPNVCYDNGTQKGGSVKMQERELESYVEQLQRGEQEALDAIYRATNKVVFATAIAILKDYHMAEDAMQDTYVRFRKNVMGYKMGNSPTAYMVTICRNVCFNILKKRKREVFVDYGENESLYGAYKMEDAHDIDDNVSTLLACLDEIERQVVLYKVYGGYKHREIAELMDKPLGTILWIYNKSMAKLKKQVVLVSE